MDVGNAEICLEHILPRAELKTSNQLFNLYVIKAHFSLNNLIENRDKMAGQPFYHASATRRAVDIDVIKYIHFRSKPYKLLIK